MKNSLKLAILAIIGLTISNFIYFNYISRKSTEIDMTPCKKFTLIRHGQGLHNIKGNKQVEDPTLTKKGKEESKLTGEKLKDEKFDLIYISPMSRTIETACEVFGPEILKNTPIVLEPKLKEMLFNANQTGREADILADTFNHCLNKEDILKLPKNWSDRQNRNMNHNDKSGSYVKEWRKTIKQIYTQSPEAQNIAIVGHSNFFEINTSDNHVFKNAEARQYEICDWKMKFIKDY